MARRAIISLLAGLVVTLSWASPALADETGAATQPRPRVEQRAFSGTMKEYSLARFQLRNVKTGETTTPFVTITASPCNPPVSFSGVANYTNGVLTSVTLDYQAQVFCPPGLNMGAIVVTAQLWRDVTMLDEAPTVNCVECLTSPVSQDFYACGGVGCAGSYWAANLHLLRAPTGFVWTGAPAGCIGIGSNGSNPPYDWLQCTNVTNIAVVPPNI